MCTTEKAKKTFLQHLPVVKSFKVVIIPVYMLKTHAHADFL